MNYSLLKTCKGEMIYITNSCYDCKHYPELPNGKRCRKCDNGSLFIPKPNGDNRMNKIMTVEEFYKKLEDLITLGYGDKYVTYDVVCRIACCDYDPELDIVVII